MIYWIHIEKMNAFKCQPPNILIVRHKAPLQIDIEILQPCTILSKKGDDKAISYDDNQLNII